MYRSMTNNSGQTEKPVMTVIVSCKNGERIIVSDCTQYEILPTGICNIYVKGKCKISFNFAEILYITEEHSAENITWLKMQSVKTGGKK